MIKQSLFNEIRVHPLLTCSYIWLYCVQCVHRIQYIWALIHLVRRAFNVMVKTKAQTHIESDINLNVSKINYVLQKSIEQSCLGVWKLLKIGASTQSIHWTSIWNSNCWIRINGKANCQLDEPRYNSMAMLRCVEISEISIISFDSLVIGNLDSIFNRNEPNIRQRQRMIEF